MHSFQIEAARAIARWSQTDLAERANSSLSTISQVESGARAASKALNKRLLRSLPKKEFSSLNTASKNAIQTPMSLMEKTFGSMFWKMFTPVCLIRRMRKCFFFALTIGNPLKL